MMRTWLMSRTVMITMVIAGMAALSPTAAKEDDYIKSLNAYEGSIGCLAKLKGPAPGPELYVYVWLVDPTGTEIANDDDFTYSTNLEVNFAVEPTVSGVYT